jgi:hypothetical protein
MVGLVFDTEVVIGDGAGIGAGEGGEMACGGPGITGLVDTDGAKLFEGTGSFAVGSSEFDCRGVSGIRGGMGARGFT